MIRLTRRTLTSAAVAICAALAVLLVGSSSASAASSGAVAWGLDLSAQLGNGTCSEYSLPGPISGISGVRTLSAGNSQSLALLGTGAVLAWGDGPYGQLGAPGPTDVPVAVGNLASATAISAGTLDS